MLTRLTLFSCSGCQQIGNTWFDKFDTPLLKVPSAVVIQCYNYVINAQQNDYKRIKVVGVTELISGPGVDESISAYKNEWITYRTLPSPKI